MRDALAGRDIGAVFRFLHQRGWSWASVAQATDIGEQRVREIANGKRRVENYDVYVRVAVGLNIPRDSLGVGLRRADGDGTLTGTVTAPAPPARLTAALRTTLELATPAKADGSEPPDLGQFEELVMQAWEDRRRNGHRDTTLALVAGFAGSGKTEFSAQSASLSLPLAEPNGDSLGGVPAACCDGRDHLLGAVASSPVWAMARQSSSDASATRRARAARMRGLWVSTPAPHTLT
jgi:hypothetical protein